MEIRYSPGAVRALDKISPQARRRIIAKMRFYASAPDPLEFAEYLTDDPEAPYRFRIGKDWRIKFAVASGVLVVKRIGQRDKIYQRR